MKRLIIFTLILTGVISGIMSGADQPEPKSSPSINYDLIEKTYSVKGMNGSFPTPLIYLNSYVNSRTPYKDVTNFNKLLVSMLNHGSYPFGRNYLVFVDTINTISIGNYALLDLTKNGNVDFSKKNLVIPYFNTNRVASYPKDLDDLDKDIIDIGNEPKGIKVMTYKFKKKEQYNNILNYTKQFYDLMRNAWVLLDFQGYIYYAGAEDSPASSHLVYLKYLLDPKVDLNNNYEVKKLASIPAFEDFKGDRYAKSLQLIRWILTESVVDADNADMGSINMKDFIEAHEKELNLKPFRDEILKEYGGDEVSKKEVKEVLAYKPLVLFIKHIVALYDAIMYVENKNKSKGVTDKSHEQLAGTLTDYYNTYLNAKVGKPLAKFFAVIGYIFRKDHWKRIKKDFKLKDPSSKPGFDYFTRMAYINNRIILGGNINIDLLKKNITLNKRGKLKDVKATAIKSGPFMLDFSKNHIDILYQQETYDEVIFDKEIIPDLNEMKDEEFINRFYKAVYKGNVEFYQYKIDNFDPPKEYDKEGGILFNSVCNTARSPELDGIGEPAKLNVLVMKIYDESKDVTELHVFVPYTSFGLVPRGEYNDYYYLSVPMERVLRIPGKEVKVGLTLPEYNILNIWYVDSKNNLFAQEIDFSNKGFIKDEGMYKIVK